MFKIKGYMAHTEAEYPKLQDNLSIMARIYSNPTPEIHFSLYLNL